jgi:hypothetical protein
VGDVRCHVLSAASRRAPCLIGCVSCQNCFWVCMVCGVPGDDYDGGTLSHGRLALREANVLRSHVLL